MRSKMIDPADVGRRFTSSRESQQREIFPLLAPGVDSVPVDRLPPIPKGYGKCASEGCNRICVMAFCEKCAPPIGIRYAEGATPTGGEISVAYRHNGEKVRKNHGHGTRGVPGHFTSSG
jgi:hypothetical protein